MNNRQEIKDSSDLIIELVPIQENRKLECSMVTYCKIIEDKNDTRTNYKLKAESQKLNVNDIITKYNINN